MRQADGKRGKREGDGGGGDSYNIRAENVGRRKMREKNWDLAT